MRKTALIIVCILSTISLFSQQKYWQQEVNFTINVSLNDKERTLDAFETLEYINNSPDTLYYIWFHLWPNAYKNDKTAFSEQTLKNGSTAFYFSTAEERGYINRLDFKADNITAKLETSDNIDIAKIVLPTPLPPGKKTIITTPFHVKLPFNFSRGGYVGDDFQVSQWFPKPAVYDHKGWHPMPYLDQGEFYSEFGSYDVEINAPANYLVAATGVLQDEETLKEIKQKGKQSITTGSKLWHFKQSNIHDFAWFASNDFIAKYDTVTLPSQKVIDVFSYYDPARSDGWKNSLEYAKQGIRKYSKWIGDYPYSIISVVQGSRNENLGGIEYPTITLITTQDAGHELAATIVHEIGHNWFYAAIANNERDHAWMDEGINTFYQKRYEAEKDSMSSYINYFPKAMQKKAPADVEDIVLRTIEKMYKDQPIETSSAQLSAVNYELMEYYKTSRWMKLLEDTLGRSAFDKSMHTYYDQWKFKHPYPEDFKASIQQSTNQSLSTIFNNLNTTGPLQPEPVVKRVLKPAFLFNLTDTKKYNYISFLPAIGYNNYDKIMLGAMVHNYQLPFNKFQFIAGALYSPNSGKTNTLGRASYTIYNNNLNLEPAISWFNYSTNSFTLNNNTVFTSVRRITPSLKLTLFDKSDLNTRRFIAQWKTFLIKENELDFKSVIVGRDTIETVGVKPNNKTINRLVLTLDDHRALYPYSLKLATDQGSGFLRTSFIAKYYFNYKDRKSGMEARLYAGKFFYLKEKTIYESGNNQRYFLNMSGPIGDEDYTYSNYFLGRREFQGFMSQQIMERDGFFKVKSDVLSEEIGRTDNWLVALNLVTDIPSGINPLKVLPFKIPLKVFVDVGTYANANKTNGGAGTFLYDAGLQVPLFGSFINVYFPIIYSKVYSDFFKSTIPDHRFLKNIAFSINLEKLKPTKVLGYIPL